MFCVATLLGSGSTERSLLFFLSLHLQLQLARPSSEQRRKLISRRPSGLIVPAAAVVGHVASGANSLSRRKENSPGQPRKFEARSPGKEWKLFPRQVASRSRLRASFGALQSRHHLSAGRASVRRSPRPALDGARAEIGSTIDHSTRAREPLHNKGRARVLFIFHRRPKSRPSRGSKLNRHKGA